MSHFRKNPLFFNTGGWSGRSLDFLSRKVRGEDGGDEEEWEWLCSEVRFLATTLNADSKDWGLYLEIKTRNAVWHKAAQGAPRPLSPEILCALRSQGWLSRRGLCTP